MRRRKSALIKSNNPHLAGGEIPNCLAANAQRYFTPAALPKREDLKFRACRSMLSTTS